VLQKVDQLTFWFGRDQDSVKTRSPILRYSHAHPDFLQARISRISYPYLNSPNRSNTPDPHRAKENVRPEHTQFNWCVGGLGQCRLIGAHKTGAMADLREAWARCTSNRLGRVRGEGQRLIGRHRDWWSPLYLRTPVLVSSWVLSGQGWVGAVGWVLTEGVNTAEPAVDVSW
jgi:hypothetical protein